MTTKYSLSLQPGYACWVSAQSVDKEYVHVNFTTEIYGEDVKYKTIQKTFDLFLYPEELDTLILSLQAAKTSHNTQGKNNE